MKIIDLSHEINSNSPIYPGDEKLELKLARSVSNDGYNAYMISSFFHASTHIETPNHLIDSGKKISDYKLDKFVGDAVLLNCVGQKEISMNKEYERIDFKDKIVLIYTGFDKHYWEHDYFTNHPTISKDLIDSLINKKIKILGIDFPSPDFEPYNIHKKLFNNDILIIENLTNLKSLVGISSFKVFALPLKMDTEASFTRVVAIIE